MQKPALKLRRLFIITAIYIASLPGKFVKFEKQTLSCPHHLLLFDHSRALI